MRDKANEFSERYGHNYSVIATPAEGLSGRFTKYDRAKFGVIEGVTDKDYYTNSNHVPVFYHCSPRHKAKVETPYHEMTRGGHIFYVEIDGDATLYHPKEIAGLAKAIQESGHKVWLYTGFTIEEILASKELSLPLPYLDAIVDGPYIQSLRDPDLPFRGSSNQRIVEVASLRTKCG